MSRLPLLATLAALASGSVFLGSAPVRAHAIESSLQRIMELRQSMDRAKGAPEASGGDLQLESRFSNGLPAAAATVRLLPPDGGDPIELGRTNESGRFQFRLPAQAGSDWEIQVDAGPGHRDYLEMPGSEPAGSASAAPPPALSQAGRETVVRRVNGLPAMLMLGLVSGVGLGGLLLRRQGRR